MYYYTMCVRHYSDNNTWFLSLLECDVPGCVPAVSCLPAVKLEMIIFCDLQSNWKVPGRTRFDPLSSNLEYSEK